MRPSSDMNGYVVPIDPTHLSRFVGSDPRGEDYEDTSEEEFLEAQQAEEIAEMQDLLQRQQNLSKLYDFLLQIPEREADIIELYFLYGKRQLDIASIFGMTQAAVSYRLARGIKRIRFLLEMPEVTLEDLTRDLSEVFPGRSGELSVDVRILISMWSTTCQSVVAKQLALTQGHVRHRFFKAVQDLKTAAEEDAKYIPYSILFEKISKNFNIKREVLLPQWINRGGDELM